MTREMASHVITSRHFHFCQHHPQVVLVLDAPSLSDESIRIHFWAFVNSISQSLLAADKAKWVFVAYFAIPFDLRTVEWVFVVLLRHPF